MSACWISYWRLHVRHDLGLYIISLKHMHCLTSPGSSLEPSHDYTKSHLHSLHLDEAPKQSV